MPTTIRFVDIAGLGARRVQGRGAGQPVLVAHPRGRRGGARGALLRRRQRDPRREPGRPVADIATIDTELCLKDLDTRRASASTRRASRARATTRWRSSRSRCASDSSQHLDEGKPARTFVAATTKENERSCATCSCSPSKRMFYVANVDEASLANSSERALRGARRVRGSRGRARRADLCAASKRRSPSSSRRIAPSSWRAWVLKEPGLNAVIRTGYELLGPHHVLDRGQTRGARLDGRKGSTAPQAAGVIHTDFERGFIKAEVILVGRPGRARQRSQVPRSRQARASKARTTSCATAT